MTAFSAPMMVNFIRKPNLSNTLGSCSPITTARVNPRDYTIHVYGNTAVINFRLTGHEQFTDADIISEQRQTETYIKQNGSWLLVARQWGNLPVNFRKAVAVDASVYRDFVGEYEWRPGDDLDVVSVKDGKLWSRFGKDADEYLPLGSDTFFVKSDLGSVTFSRDAEGHVTGYTYHRVDGQEIHVRRSSEHADKHAANDHEAVFS